MECSGLWSRLPAGRISGVICIINLKRFSYDGYGRNGHGNGYWDVDTLDFSFCHFGVTDYVAGKAGKEVIMEKKRLLLYITGIGFLLNLIWEVTQRPLYEGYVGFWHHFLNCLWASVVDVIVILVFGMLFASYYKNPFWVKHISWKDVLVLMLLGAAVAVGFEQLMLGEGAWAYTDAMPVVPYLATGLSPLLQMMILPSLTFWLSGRFT